MIRRDDDKLVQARIPSSTHKKFRLKLVEENRSIQDVIAEKIEEYVRGEEVNKRG